nr:2-oxoglutarate and iron-dependent oxygenase JMJD4 [Vicugna pacos]
MRPAAGARRAAFRLRRELRPRNLGSPRLRRDDCALPVPVLRLLRDRGRWAASCGCPERLRRAFTEDWGSRRLWVTPGGKPNFDYLLQNYGHLVVPVANCGVQEYNSNPKEHMPLRDYISYWKEYIQGNYSSPRGCLYLKDWHLCRDSSAEDVFTLPVYFSSDWLNEYWDVLGVDDYRFVYMGPGGTWRTPSPSTTTGSTAVTWPTCGTSCSRSSGRCSGRSSSGGTPCPTGTTTARWDGWSEQEQGARGGSPGLQWEDGYGPHQEAGAGGLQLRLALKQLELEVQLDLMVELLLSLVTDLAQGSKRSLALGWLCLCSPNRFRV